MALVIVWLHDIADPRGATTPFRGVAHHSLA
jgi:hypothetical protein